MPLPLPVPAPGNAPLPGVGAPTLLAPQVSLPGVGAAPPPPGAQFQQAAPLPVAGQAAPQGNFGVTAQAALAPIYSDASTRAAASADALDRALNGAQQSITQNIANKAAAVGAPGGGYEAGTAVASIPQTALLNLQNRALGYESDLQQGLQRQQTDATQSLANTLQSTQFATQQAANAAAAKVAAENIKLTASGGLTPYQMFEMENTLGKQNAAAQTSIAGLQSQANTALGALLDPKTGLPKSGSTLAQAEKLVEDQYGPVMQNLGVTPQTLEQGMNQFRNQFVAGSATPQTGDYTRGKVTVGTPGHPGDTLPLLPLPSGVQDSPALDRALGLYEANAIPGDRGNLMDLITQQFGTPIANQVRQTVSAQGSNLSPYLDRAQSGPLAGLSAKQLDSKIATYLNSLNKK